MVLTNTETKRVNFYNDSRLERYHTRTIRSILGNFFIGQDTEEDQKRATDFLTFTVNPFRVAVRLRRYKYFKDYSKQFTIRYSRPSGVKTELAKILEGFADYLLYGFVSVSQEKIIQYFIGDLSIFRAIAPNPIAIKPNDPYDSELAIYSLSQFPDNFTVKFWRALGY